MKTTFIILLFSGLIFAEGIFNNSGFELNLNDFSASTFSVIQVFPEDTCHTDPYEPNDTPAEAFQLQFGDTVAGAFICPIDDVDYFYFEAEEGEYISIKEISSVVTRPTIYVLRENLSWFFNNLYTTDMRFFVPATGKYYILAVKRYNINEPFAYSFVLDKIDVTPNVILVTDVPNDQGLQVSVVWNASYFDPVQGTNQTNYYALWREVNDTLNNNRVISSQIYESFDMVDYENISAGSDQLYRVNSGLWDFIAQIPAVSNRPFTNYSYAAPTLYDNVPTTFVVSAIPKQGFDLPVLWGRTGTGVSVDNLSPEFVNYTIESNTNSILLKWEIDRVVHFDIDGFNIYRHTEKNFLPDEETLYQNLLPESNLFNDVNIEAGKTYYYVIEVFDNSGNSTFSSELSTLISSASDRIISVPKEFGLMQNYPNPFNPATTIKYQLPRAAWVEMFIYNILGNKVAEPVNQFQQAGYYTINFDASDLPSGVYFYKLQAGEYVNTKKFILTK